MPLIIITLIIIVCTTLILCPLGRDSVGANKAKIAFPRLHKPRIHPNSQLIFLTSATDTSGDPSVCKSISSALPSCTMVGLFSPILTTDFQRPSIIHNLRTLCNTHKLRHFIGDRQTDHSIASTTCFLQIRQQQEPSRCMQCPCRHQRRIKPGNRRQ